MTTNARCNASLQQKGSDLIDDASALADEPRAHPMHADRVVVIDNGVVALNLRLDLPRPRERGAGEGR
jgi:hypothetical protein